MTYDQWKTTDPREYERDEEDGAPSELELVYEQLHETQQDAKHAAEMSASRIKTLEAALEEALEYIKQDYDGLDGDGGPLPNRAMQLGTMIDEILHGIRF